MTRSPSVKDVARLAGVSTATVSRALNKADTVSNKTRDSVLQAALEVGYKPNHAGRSLRLRRAGAVAVLIPNVGNPFFSEILAGIESVMTETGINVLILDSQGASSHSDIADYLTRQSADGIICLDGSLQPDSDTTNSTMLNLPVVFGCEWPSDHTSISSVRSDNAAGARLAVEHFVALGHKKIGHVKGPESNVLTAERGQAFVDALNDHDLPVVDSWFFAGDFSLESGTMAAKKWFALDDRPTALFCFSDLMAIGVMAELRLRGVDVPNDVSVMGFDDIDIARYYAPALTTIKQSTRELGVEAAVTLLGKLNGTGQEGVLRLLEVELIQRSSTAVVKTDSDT